MATNYATHFLLDTTTVCEYIKNTVDFFDKNDCLTAKEIGDGNINYVFHVSSKNTGKSLVIKQADVLLRSSGRPLDVYRNKIESEILKLQRELAKDFIPEIFHYDEVMYAIIMEDISSYTSLRTALMNCEIFPNLAEDISTFLAKTLLSTTDLVMDRAKKKNLVKQFINVELCDISEDLVFTEPYYDYKKQNVIVPEQLAFVEENLYQNSVLKTAVGRLRNRFMNHAQALIHGDLHSGSIFINDTGMKVIDPEFAFYGPMGYDVGNVIANFFFSLAYAKFVHPNNEKFIGYMEETIANTIDLFKEKLSNEYDALVTFPFYKESEFKSHYIKEIFNDAFGYAGTEIIRRIVGDAKVKEITTLTELNIKLPMERALIKLGIQLILESESIHSGSDVVRRFRLITA